MPCARKHERPIELTAWQWAYVWQEPGFFTNHSLDIQHRRASVALLDEIVGPKT